MAAASGTVLRNTGAANTSARTLLVVLIGGPPEREEKRGRETGGQTSDGEGTTPEKKKNGTVWHQTWDENNTKMFIHDKIQIRRTA